MPQPDREAIFHFALLWSLFEARVLDTRANPPRILAAVQVWQNIAPLEIATLADALGFFRQRYFPDGNASYHYEQLNLHPDYLELATRVLAGADATNLEKLQVLLLIVYRLRNNLMHGVKWEYFMVGQLPNFTHANNILMRVMDIHGMV